jgi:Uma2 family endonuclease
MASAELVSPEIAPTADGDQVLYEIVDDRQVEQPPMGVYAGKIASVLLLKLGLFVEAHELGQTVVEVLFRIRSRPNLQRRPDLAFVSFERWARGRRTPTANAWEVVPDLAVEVVSPSNLAEEIPTRVREYFDAGVRRVWVIYTHESLIYEYDSTHSIRVLGREDFLDGGAVVPGFRLALTELFEEPEAVADPA